MDSHQWMMQVTFPCELVLASYIHTQGQPALSRNDSYHVEACSLYDRLPCALGKSGLLMASVEMHTLMFSFPARTLRHRKVW